MRWFIEVSSGNPTGPAEQWVVEAAQWQPALQAARALRGEPVETTGFSIELLEDGFRVIDPATLVRYIVRRAPDTAPLSTTHATKVAPPSTASNGGAPEEAAVKAGPTGPAAPATAGTNGGSPASSAPKSVAPPAAAPAPTPSDAPLTASVPATAPPSAAPPAADTSGMTQAERIAAMLSVDSAPRGSSRAPSGAPKSGAPKGTPRSVPATSSRSGGQASRPPRPSDGAPPPSPSGAVMRAPQVAALRAPQAAAVAVPESSDPVSNATSAAAPEALPADAPAAEPQEPAQPPPPRLITQPPAMPVVQSLSELQALVHQSVPPRPASQPPPAPSTHAIQPPPAIQTSQPPPAEALISPSMHPSPSSPPDPLPSASLLFQRSEDPSASSPLTYREAAWAVAEGTSIAAAVRLLAGMFEGVRAALAGIKPGKLVYMAIFDHHFVGKPTRPPLATLTWKDWKDQGQGPEIRRLGEPRTSFQPPAMSNSFIPAAVPQPPVAMPQAPLPDASAVAAPSVDSIKAPPAVAPAAAPAVPVVLVAPAAAPVPVAPTMPPPVTVPSVPAEAPAPVPAVAEQLSAPVADVAAPAPAVTAAPPMLVIVPESDTSLSVAAPRAAAPSSPAVRLSGVELIADLFECMHDLHFLADALAGADFVLALMLDKLPSAVALVHFYDIDAREFVVVRAVGAGAAKVMQVRTNEKEPLIAEAMHKRRAVVLDDASADPRAQNGRWALIGDPPRSMICAPVEEGGRFLGLIELSNPLDGQPFREGDGHAVTYIGEQFAEFLAARGVILDPERIGD